MVDESLDVFTKRVLVEKHIVVSCVKFRGATAPPCLPLPMVMCTSIKYLNNKLIVQKLTHFINKAE